MTPQEKKRLSRLLALLGVLVLVWIVLGGDIMSSNPTTDSSATQVSLAKLAGDVQSLGQLPALMLQRPDEGEMYEPRRNLFEFTKSPEAVARDLAEQRAAEEARRRQEEEQRKQAKFLAEHPPPPTPPPPPPAPVPPTFNWIYMGHAITRGSSEEIQAFIQQTAGKRDRQWVKVGDVIENRFVVQKISEDSITFGYTDPQFKDQTQNVRMQGNKQVRR